MSMEPIIIGTLALTLITLFLTLKNQQNMATKEDFQNLKQGMDAGMGNLRGDVTKLKANIEALEERINELLGEGGLTKAEETEVFNLFAGVKADIDSLAGDTPETPVEPEEPQEPAA